MDELEDSTLDLIRRRGVTPLNPAYVVILTVVFCLAALPLIRVTRVVNARGIIRPAADPAEICAPVAGMIDSTILVNNLVVTAGDTVAWIRQEIPDTRIGEYERLIVKNLEFIGDIRLILAGNLPVKTPRYIQSHRHHESALLTLQLQEEYLKDEFAVSEKLFHEQVIPVREFRRTGSEYRLASARVEDLQQQYRNSLEEELVRLEMENSRYNAEIGLIRASLADYFVIASVSGSVQNCSGVSSGSVVRSGVPLGIISPSGSLTAECYLDPGLIPLVGPGIPVRLHFDGPRTLDPGRLDAVVDQVDDDVLMMDGYPMLRVRCSMEAASLKKGMTFTASFVLGRETLAALVLEKIDLRFNPSRSTPEKHE